MTWDGGFGVVGQGVGGNPSRTRTRPDLCPAYGHPGVTYHPQQDRTWCLCGEHIYDGNTVVVPHMACCGGPLTELISSIRQPADVSTPAA